MVEGFGPDSETGEFDRPFVDTISNSIREGIKSRADGPIELSPGSPYGSIVDGVTDEFSSVWESLESTYYAPYMETAQGIQLDRIFALGMVGRLERRGATGEIIARTTDDGSGRPTTDPIEIEAGTRVSTAAIPEDDIPIIPFVVTEDAVISAGESESDPIPIRGTNPTDLRGLDIDETWLGSETNVEAGTVTELVDPIGGIPSSGGITNPLPTGEPGTRADGTEANFRRGRDRERDYEYVQRWKAQLAQNGKATLPALSANMYALDGGGLVTGVQVRENVLWEYQNGLPPKSIELTVDMPRSQENIDKAAQAITDTRSGGIRSVGEHKGTSTLPSGRSKEQHIDLAEQVTIYVNVALEVYDSFPGSGSERVEQNILAYIGGQLRGLRLAGEADVGDTVIYDKVESAVTSGLFDDIKRRDVTIGRKATEMGYQDIEMGDDEVAITSRAVISVSVNQADR